MKQGIYCRYVGDQKKISNVITSSTLSIFRLFEKLALE